MDIAARDKDREDRALPDIIDLSGGRKDISRAASTIRWGSRWATGNDSPLVPAYPVPFYLAIYVWQWKWGCSLRIDNRAPIDCRPLSFLL